MRYLLMILLLCTASLHAQEYSDAPASYGGMHAWSAGQTCWLGDLASNDAANPVTPAWTGDDDDGLVGTPLWSSWSSHNSISFMVNGNGGTTEGVTPTMVYLVLFVDANDDGQFSPDETYLYSPFRVPVGRIYTFNNISIHATQDFMLNGAHKVGVRIAVQDTIGGPPVLSPNGSFFMGEVEDWLIDISPAGLHIATEELPPATEGAAYTTDIEAVNGQAPYQWSLISGTLPTGVTPAQTGDVFRLSGTPAAGTAPADYTFTVQVSDDGGATATRDFTLRVMPTPYALPFRDDFAIDTGWTLEHLWARAAVSGAAGSAVYPNFHGQFPSEPSQDFTPGSTDNMALMDSPGMAYEHGMPHEAWATSPRFDCSQESDVQLRFRRWLSHANGFSSIRIQARGNGDWVTVWDRVEPLPSGIPMAYPTTVDVGWTLERVDISAVVAGCATAQVRFGIGPEMYGEWNWYGYMGWCIDDLEIVRTPLNGPMTAGEPNVASPNHFTATGWPAPLPVLYPGSDHAWSIDIDNSTGPAFSVTDVEVAIKVDVYVPSWWILPLHYEANNSWYDYGTSSLSGSTPVPAGAAATTINGLIHFTGMPLNFALTQVTAHFFVRGTVNGTGQTIELHTTTRVTPNPSPLPGLRVHEESSSGPQISNGAPAAGLRAFGSVAAGSASSWVNIVLRNTSSTPLNLVAPTLEGQDPAHFELYTAAMNFTLTSGQTTWFSVRFVPTGPGAREAVVRFTHDAANTGTPFEFAVSGLGIGNGPVLAVREVDAAGAMIANGSAATGGRDFGQVVSGNQASLVIFVENSGNQDLTLGSPMLSGPDAAHFALVGSLPASLAAGISTSFELVYAPTAWGHHAATVEFAHNDPGQGAAFTFDVAGQGIGNTPRIVVNEGFIGGPAIVAGAPAGGARQFGSLDVHAGPTAEVVILIGNIGWQPMTLTSPTLAGQHAADFILDDGRMEFVLQPGEWTGFSVAFEPRAKGLKTAVISFAHDDPAVGQPFTLEVQGIGVDPNGVFIDMTSLPQGRAGAGYSHALSASLGTSPYTWDLTQGTLPAGMTLGAAGTLEGSPLDFGVFGLRLRVTDALGGDDQRYFELVIDPPPGHLGKDSGKASGCAADVASHGWALLFLLAAALYRRGRQRA